MVVNKRGEEEDDTAIMSTLFSISLLASTVSSLSAIFDDAGTPWTGN